MTTRRSRRLVILRCPLCGSWIVNTFFRAHQDAYHPESPESAFYDLWRLSGILEEVVDFPHDGGDADDRPEELDPPSPDGR